MDRLKRLTLCLCLGAASYLSGCGPTPIPSEVQPAAPETTADATLESDSAPPQQVLPLTALGQAQEISPGESHRYAIELAAEQWLEVEVIQQGSDVESLLLDAKGQSLIHVDSRSRDRGTERLLFVTSAVGRYELIIRAFQNNPASGRYTASLEQRSASPFDRQVAAAEASFAESFLLLQRLRTPQERQRAKALFKDAAEGFGDVDRPLRRAAAHFELATLLRADGDAVQALGYYTQCLPWFVDTPDGPHIHNEMGLLSKELGNPDGARHHFETALILLEQQPGLAGTEAAVRTNLGRLDTLQGRALDALAQLERAQRLWIDLGRRRQVAETHNAMGEVYESLGDPSSALDLHRRALALLDPETDVLARAITLCHMGRALLEAGDLPNAARHYGQCLEARQRGNATAGDKARAQAGLGAVEMRRGNPQPALHLFRQSLSVFEEQANLIGQAVMLDNMAWIYSDQGQFDPAVDLHRRALDLYDRLTHHEGQALSYLGLATVQRRRGDPAAALDAARQAVEAVQKVVNSGQTPARRDDLLLPYMATRQGYYATYIDLLMEHHQLQPDAGYAAIALSISEQARARHLVEILAHRPLDARVTKPTASAAKTTLQAMTLLDLQSLLDEQTLVLEYHLGESRSVLWAVDQHQMTSYLLPGRAHLELLARRAYEAVRRSDQINLRGPAERDLALLSDALLGPLTHRLDGQRLLIVTNGALELIPFAALPAPGSDNRRLVEAHEILNLPSASALALLRRRSTTPPPLANGLVAIVADAVYEPTDERLQGLEAESLVEGIPTLGRIPFSGREAQTIERLAASPGRVLSLAGFEAHRGRFDDGSLNDYRILHLATHGLLRQEHPDHAALIFSRFGPDGRALQGRLTLGEIYGLDLKAELVVLSACQSALGREVRGEGMMGLPRGFLYAGAQQVVASLWQVHDQSTAELMSRFYHQLWNEGLPPAAALRAAQRSMLGEPQWAPYHWAGFIIQGDWMTPSKNFP